MDSGGAAAQSCYCSLRSPNQQRRYALERYLMVADELLADARMEGWSRDSVAIWIRDACRCVFCGHDMTADRNALIHVQQNEHLLPVKKYPHLEAPLWNRSLACKDCNCLKGTWDPNAAGEPLYLGEEVEPINKEEIRTELLRRTREYLSKSLEERERRFTEQKLLLRSGLKRVGGVAPIVP
jgi:Zn ribbon nucleic-acid-binding protein